LTRSSRPLAKSSGEALTLPTMTLLPRTKPWLIMSAFTSALRSPPVTLTSTSTPFLPSASAASNTNGLKPVASTMMSKGPYCSAPAPSGVCLVLT
jgi:hypothetical protein